MSSLTQLPLDKAADETGVAGWDETIENSSISSSSSSSFQVSISRHAVAHQSVVCGLQAATPSNWITWKTSLAPHRVCQVASNQDGSIIAASKDNGTISILRGSDGTIMATRRVAAEGVRTPAGLFFCRHALNNTDTLVIEPPMEGPPVLVSNIQGERLNSSNPGTVSEGVRDMSIQVMQLDGVDDIRALRGSCRTGDANTIRFVLVDGNGQIHVYDYKLHEKKAQVVSRNISIGEHWEVDFDVGLRVQEFGTDQSYLLLSAYKGNATKICWLDLLHLNMACDYIIPQTGTKRPRVVTMEPVESCSKDSSMAIAIATKPAVDSPQVDISIIQVLVEDTMGLAVVTHPHELYKIPMNHAVQSLAIAPLLSTPAGPYSFLCKSCQGKENHACHVFASRSQKQDGAVIGSLRLFLERELFDQAHELVVETGAQILVDDPYAHFHPSEIALRRLELLLQQGTVSSGRSIEQSRDCLRQLATGAVSENENGQGALLKAAETILKWPAANSYQNPTILEVVMALSAFVSTLSKVIDAITPSQATTFKDKRAQLEERLSAMKYLESIVEDSKTMRVNAKFAGIRSSEELFACLVESSYFLSAEQMWRSHLRPKLTTDAMVSSMLGVSPTVNPRGYASLLQEIIFPSLTINHELLPPLLAWSCQTADTFDEEGAKSQSLDESIFLLEIVERATKSLRVRVHSSFASSSPFVGKTEARKVRGSSPRNGDFESSTLDVTFASLGSSPSSQQNHGAPPSPSIERPSPTILELGRLKGGAQKSRLGQTTLLSVDAVDASEETVEAKLTFARLLKQARSLGLERSLVSLRTFSNCGGAQFIAKELIRLFSSSALDHEGRVQKLSTHVKHFCERADASFDQALLQYANTLCGGKTTSKSAIQESASVARCCSEASIKCQVTLITLRAALFCRYSPSWLSKLSLEAIEWASGDSVLRSELEEASRLLLIDGIVGRYCGEGAKELFHVDNPRHAIRLLEFVAQHIHDEAGLSDALDLCEAFHHLSREHACSLVLQNAILKGEQDLSCSFLESLYRKNAMLAKATFALVISFCIDLIEECSLVISSDASEYQIKKRENQAKLVTSCACALTPVSLANIHSSAGGFVGESSSSHLDEAKLEDRMQDFEIIRALQTDHSIFLSIYDLHQPNALVRVATEMFDPIVQSYVEGNPQTSSTIVTRTRRVCSLLARSSQIQDYDLWYAAAGSSACLLAWKTQDGQCMDFLADLGVLEAAQNSVAARSCLAVALALCMKASKQLDSVPALTSMKNVILASSLLQDHALLSCPDVFLSATLSLGELVDIVSQVLVRSDEGIGEQLDDLRKELHTTAAAKRWSFAPTNERVESDVGDSLRLRRPALHSTWYVGDGLLLPPMEALARGIEYCRYSMGTGSRQLMSVPSHAGLNLHYFVESRGAYALTLRLMCNSTVNQLCSPGSDASFDAMAEANQQTAVSLAERYLGGTGDGITSGLVDSQLAVAYLLCLPLKQAFKVYRSTLPTAITTRDFSRVVTLASIGKVAGSGDLLVSNSDNVTFGWKRQQKFVTQCELLASRAVWWSVLQKYHVNFDPRRFEDTTSKNQDSGKGDDVTTSKYAASLIPSLISNLSKTEDNAGLILQVASNFATSFGLSHNLAIQLYVEYLLSPPPEQLSKEAHDTDIRFKLNRMEFTARNLLRQLEPPLKRCSVLRHCLVKLESSNLGTDYERSATVLTLYQSELGVVLSQDLKKQKIDPRPHVKDLELVDRRRDALAILSSYFQGERKQARPVFSKFFPSFEDVGDSESSRKKPLACSILGPESASDPEIFDPLSPLEDILRSSCNAAATSALAPMCLALGVPWGYIHARSLIVRFLKSKSGDVAFPSFEGDVLPVLNRLKSSGDKAELAEWCSTRYSFENEDKLKCLDLALKYAMQASSEAEQFGGSTERQALDRVKRITSTKDLLSDRLAINSILRSGQGVSEKHVCLVKIIDELMARLEAQVWNKEEFVPERFIDIFLSESSLLAAEASLDGAEALSMGQFRQLSMLVHRACKTIADKYSHVQVGSFARRLTRRWLFHGDQVCSKKGTSEIEEEELPAISNQIGNVSHLLPDIDEEDTINFVMDLSSLRDVNNAWSADIGSGPSALQLERKLTSEEEPNSLKSGGSAREASELASRRAALRIAFVMAFADGYHSSSLYEDPLDEENSSASANNQGGSRASVKKTRGGLLAKIGSRGGKQQHDTVMEHSRELVNIVFAKSGGSELADRDLSTSFDSRSVDGSSRGQTRQTITFAMRHRALRAASILCPQEAMDEVIKDEGFISANTACSLKKCTFGVFVAKEIEEMGLPLPHSDLAQLSTMHFPSYARALWRHHRDGDLKGSKGRLLLLILEMYLKDKVTDGAFIASILTEMSRLNLPRTLMLAAECIADYKNRVGLAAFSSYTKETNNAIPAAVDAVSTMVLSELQKTLEGERPSKPETIDGLETVRRIGEIMQSFCNTTDGQGNLVKFIEALLPIMESHSANKFVYTIGETVITALRRVADKGIGEKLLRRISTETEGGKEVLQRLISRKATTPLQDEEASNDRGSLFTALDLLESSLSNCYVE
jgi:hypothetical protein